MKIFTFGLIFWLLLFAVVFSACRKLPDLPENYEEQHKLNAYHELTISCEDELEDNLLFVNGDIDGKLEFNIDTVYYRTSNNNGQYSRISIVVYDYDNELTLEIEGVKPNMGYNGILEYSIGNYDSYSAREASVVLYSRTDNNNTSYYPEEEGYIYLDLSETSVTISLCSLVFEPQGADENAFGISGRIIKNI